MSSRNRLLARYGAGRASLGWLLSSVGLVASGSALAAQGATDSCSGAATAGFIAFGIVFGYFLTYSIRYGSKTQDVFKSFFGALGAGGGAATTLLVSEACRLPLLVAYGTGTIAGFVVF